MGFNLLPWRARRDRRCRYRFYGILFVLALGMTSLQALFWWQHQKAYETLESVADHTQETLRALELGWADMQAHSDQDIADAAWVEAQIKLMAASQAMMRSPAELIAHIVSARPALFWIERVAFDRPEDAHPQGMVVVEAKVAVRESLTELVQPFNQGRGEQVEVGELAVNPSGLYDVRLDIVP